MTTATATAGDVRVCRCGCGGELSSKWSEFAPGHNARLAERGPGQRMRPVRQHAICACGCGETVPTLGGTFKRGHHRRLVGRKQGGICNCGCGERVKTAGRRYRQGHASRMPGAPKPPNRNPDPEEVESTCSACGKTWTRRLNYGRGFYCSRECRAVAERATPHPKSKLGRFLLERFRESRQTHAAYAATIGIDRKPLFQLQRDHLPTQRTYDRLRAFFGDDLPASPTETERRSAAALERKAELLRLAQTPEAKAKRSASLRGKPKTPEHVAKMVKTQTEIGHFDVLAAASRAYATSTKGRAVRSLSRRLASNPAPTSAQLQEWAGEASLNLDLPVEGIRVFWDAWLKKNKKGVGLGLNTTHLLLCELRSRRPPLKRREMLNHPDVEYHFSDIVSMSTSHINWHKNHSIPPCRPL